MDRCLRNKTYNEPTTFVVDILLQRRLTQMLDKVGTRTLGTNLIIHHGIADVLDQAAELIHIPGAFQEPCNLASSFQWDKVLKNIIQFPGELYTSDWVSILERVGYRLRIVLLPSSLTSPSGTGALNDSASPSTRGISDSIVWRQAIIC